MSALLWEYKRLDLAIDAKTVELARLRELRGKLWISMSAEEQETLQAEWRSSFETVDGITREARK